MSQVATDVSDSFFFISLSLYIHLLQSVFALDIIWIKLQTWIFFIWEDVSRYVCTCFTDGLSLLQLLLPINYENIKYCNNVTFL